MNDIFIDRDEDLSPFDAVEVHPVEELPGEWCEQIEADQIGRDPLCKYFWSVYLHFRTGGLDCVGDFDTQEAAEEFGQELEVRLGVKA